MRAEQAEGPTGRRDDLRRRLRATGGRGRKLRGLIELLRPYRGRMALMFVALVLGTAASLAPARRWRADRSPVPKRSTTCSSERKGEPSSSVRM